MSLDVPNQAADHGQALTEPTLRLVAQGGEAATVRRSVTRWLFGAEVPELVACDVVLGVHEAFAEAASHAYPGTEATVEVTVHIDDHHVVATVSDQGRWRAPGTALGSLRGKELPLLDAVAERFEVTHVGERTALTAWFGLPAPTTPPQRRH